MANINVMHIIGGGEFGGAEQHVLDLLTEMNKEMFNIKLCCLFKEPLLQLAREKGIPVFYLPMKSKFDLKTILKFSQLIKEEKIDIVHTHGVRANFIGRLSVKIAGTCKTVTTVHSLLKYDYPRFATKVFNSFLEFMTRGLSKHYIAVSNSIKYSLIKQGIKKEKITVIHNSVDFKVFSPGKLNKVREMIDVKNEEKIVGVIARFHPVKGHKYLLEAAKLLLEQESNVKFVLVGDGPYITEIKNSIDRLGISKDVFLLGFQNNIADIMRSLDMLVVPSLSEGFGLTAVEAMAVKVPVVATAVGGLLDIITDKETGILVPAGNYRAITEGLLLLLKNPELTKTITENAFVKVKQDFNQSSMSSKTEEIYISLTNKCNIAVESENEQ